MLSVLFLILCLALIIMIEYAFFKNLISISFIFTSSFLLGAICLLANVRNWNVDLNIECIGLILFTVLIAFTSEILMKNFVFNRIHRMVRERKYGILYIRTSVLALSFCFTVIELILYWREVLRIAFIAYTNGYNGSMLFNYRQITAHDDILTSSQMMNSYVVQGQKIITIFAYILMYIFLNNRVLAHDKSKKNYLYLIGLIPFVIITIFSASRIAILRIIIYILVLWFIMTNEKKRWKFHIRLGLFIKLLIIGISVLLGFAYLGTIVGRNTSLTAFQTVSVYLGAPILLLNLYLKDPITNTNIFGEECFCNLYQSFYKLGLTSNYSDFQTEFRSSNGVLLGNIYTFIRRPLHDFGIIGLAIIVFIVISIFSFVFYNYIYKRQVRMKMVIFFAYYYYIIGLSVIDFCVYSEISLGNVINIILFLLMLNIVKIKPNSDIKTRCVKI